MFRNVLGIRDISIHKSLTLMCSMMNIHLKNSVREESASCEMGSTRQYFEIRGGVCIHFLPKNHPHSFLFSCNHVLPVVDGWLLVGKVLHNSWHVANIHVQLSESNARNHLAVTELMENWPAAFKLQLSATFVIYMVWSMLKRCYILVLNFWLNFDVRTISVEWKLHKL